MNPFQPGRLTAAKENNNNVRSRTVNAREDMILQNLLNNLTRDKNAIMRHIAGAAANLQENLHTIHYGITLLQDKFDGHSIDCYNDPEFKKLAKQVFGFIKKQGTGRKIFCVAVSSPTMGPGTVYFCHYLTAKTVRPEDITMMAPFLAELEETVTHTAEIEIDNADDSTKTEPAEEKSEIPIFQQPVSLPMVPISPIGIRPTAIRPNLVRQSTNIEAGPTPVRPRLVRQSTNIKPRPVDNDGFWLDNGSNFSEEAAKPNANIESEPEQGKLNLNKSYCCIPSQKSTVDILNEIFNGAATDNLLEFSATEPPKTPSQANNLTAVNTLPQEVLELTPIVTTPAVKPSHKNAKSRLGGRRGSRQSRQHNQQNRSSFEILPEGRDDSVVLNYTVPLQHNLNRTLDEIMNRLSQLEASNKQQQSPNNEQANKVSKQIFNEGRYSGTHSPTHKKLPFGNRTKNNARR